MARGRRLAPEEAALWARVAASVTPMRRPPVAAKPAAARAPDPAPLDVPEPRPPAPLDLDKLKRIGSRVKAPAGITVVTAPAPPGGTLDGGWDRRLARGLVAPESAIDLHGHTLDSAYWLLDQGLERAIARGDRVLLLITGKPPRRESERPHARGAIRAAVGDWLAASRHADRIAAVRNAHPAHGGAGALYIVLRRTRTAATRNS